MPQITSSKIHPTRRLKEGTFHFARTVGKPGRLFHKFGGVLHEFWAGEPLFLDGSNKTRSGIDLRVWGSSLVDFTGSPANNQIATFTDGDTIQGESTLTYDGSIFEVAGGSVRVSAATGTASITPADIRIGTTSAGSDWDTTTNWANLDFYSADTSSGGAGVKARIGARAVSTAGGQTNLIFEVSDTTRLDNYMMLYSTGMLQVTGNKIRFSAGRGFVYDSATAKIGIVMDGSMAFNNSMAVFTNTGRGGLGTLIPATTFQTVGTTRLGDQATNYMAVGATGDTHWVGGGGLVFGACFGDHIGAGDTLWTQVAAANTWYNISHEDMTDEILHNVTHDGSGKLTVTEPGMYIVNFSLTYQCGTANKHVEVGIIISGAGSAHPAGHAHTETKFLDQEEHLSGTVILDLADNATLEVAIQTTDAGNPTLTVDNVSLSCIQIGGT